MAILLFIERRRSAGTLLLLVKLNRFFWWAQIWTQWDWWAILHATHNVSGKEVKGQQDDYWLYCAGDHYVQFSICRDLFWQVQPPLSRSASWQCVISWGHSAILRQTCRIIIAEIYDLPVAGLEHVPGLRRWSRIIQHLWQSMKRNSLRTGY